ncbi:Rps23 Pro-64 3,4-dihydroxylase Tpa1-like proline 4-hydroxylase [Chromatocurvus halotolerans]|uniref:Rps23 Pro-64 3,4-dihydroxylase Tpa1-like proline 4-hydroxylase n=2 Tax=Chromatocurvus halotolerans TaxID=1132028 RepID=A0A4R2KWW0_9GAMM|nr:Rps23 Pro-64 3,4-dihydroxylase Tpa1-like proline 4-hydroxylase [Chromatocurvus halotolerans]
MVLNCAMKTSFRIPSGEALADATQQYREEARTRVYQVWRPDVAQGIATAMASAVFYANTFHVDGRTQLATPDELQKMGPQARQQLGEKINAGAADGVGFLYERYYLPEQPEASVPEPLYGVAETLNSEPVLAMVREVSGIDDISCASMQVTRYRAGHFLTRHNDVVPAEQRRVAYVLGFTPRWHPDWGGLLQFYRQDGVPQDAWAPGFNDLMLFDVHRVHAVTYVAPFAGAPRQAISGWFSAGSL